VDYTLAPDRQYPTQVDECYSVLKWLSSVDNLRRLGIRCRDEKPRIVVTGDSAGGNLSLAITLKALKEEEQEEKQEEQKNEKAKKEGRKMSEKIIGLVLHYPVTYVHSSLSCSRVLCGNDVVLAFDTLLLCLHAYLPPQFQQNALEDDLISPGVTTDALLRKLPPTVMYVGTLDPLLDDSILLF